MENAKTVTTSCSSNRLTTVTNHCVVIMSRHQDFMNALTAESSSGIYVNNVLVK